MGVMADEVAAKKATFVPTTSSPLQVWAGGQGDQRAVAALLRRHQRGGNARRVVPVDDLNARGVAYYNMVGADRRRPPSPTCGDKAHFDKAGRNRDGPASPPKSSSGLYNSPLAGYLK